MPIVRAWIASTVLVLGVAADGQSPAPGAACEQLSTLAIAGVSIRRAQSVDAGSFPRPDSHRDRRRRSRVAGVLPRRSDTEALQRFGDHDRSLDADDRVEREIPGGRQRRVQRHYQRDRDARGAVARLCHQFHRHRAYRRGRPVGRRPSGEGRRLWLARGPRNDGDRQADHRALLRPPADPVILERLLRRRATGNEERAAVPARLRRHHRRRTRPRLDRTGSPGPARREGVGDRRRRTAVAAAPPAPAHRGRQRL